MCKSYIASITNKKVFETDMYDVLPDCIYEEIVVLGNKKKTFTIPDIEDRIYNKNAVKVIKVNFHN